LEQRGVIEGVDFAQDTEDGAGDAYEFIPDSDEQEGADRGNSMTDDDEVVPETELQDIVGVQSNKDQVSSADQDLKDFAIECHLQFLPEKTHAFMRQFKRNKNIYYPRR
jgi:hypothetical protein